MKSNHKASPIIVEPSILSGDFGQLSHEAKRAEEAGADALHLDIMDGHFVPNLTFGPKAVAAINRATNLFLDVHLMIYNPFEYIEKFVEAGADRIIFHLEATEDVEDTLAFIRKCGIQAGIAICPETSVDLVTKYLDRCDLVLIMSVHPGFGGQAFMPDSVDRISYLRSICEQLRIGKGGKVLKDKGAILEPFDIQVDGGIDAQTGKLCVEAGANVLVSGTFLYNAKNMNEAIQLLKGHRK